jgi:DNA-binding LacI/PurR family transcriptional regulator
MKFTTIKDIAKKLGINHSTVSRALNNDPCISGATAAKIKALAVEMDYTPNTAAKGLARARSNTIAIVTFSYFSPYPSEIMRGIEPEITKTKLEMDYYTTRRFTTVGTEGRDSYIFEKILDERKAGAIIIISINMAGSSNLLENYRKAGIHVVFIEGKGIWGHRVHYDNEKAAELAVNHLVERKRKKIGIMIGNTRYVQSYKERLNGFTKALRSHGLQADSSNVFEFPEDAPELHKTALDFFLKNKADAIYFAGGEYYMIRVLDEVWKMGIKVPDDLAIVGQDNTALSLAAGITAVRQPAVEMGRKAVEIAVRAIAENDLKNMHNEMFYPDLIIRKST